MKECNVRKLAHNGYSVEYLADLLDGKAQCKIMYKINPNGQVVVDSIIEMIKWTPELPRMGMQLQISNDFDNIKWFGRGPGESYQDRKTASSIGIYLGTVAENITAYIRPQENGNKADTRWMQLTDTQGNGWQFRGDSLFDFSVWPYTPETLESTAHDSELQNDAKFLTVNIDHKQRGVGGDNSWGALPMKKYRLLDKKYSYSFMITPIH